MSMLPLWKLKRELARAFAHLLEGPNFVAQYFGATRYHDWRLARQRKVHAGSCLLGRRAAIYLIFPQDGVQSSHLRSIEYLLENGYSPLVVSNQPLSAKDLKRLLPISWRVIERANFGYDFGGYRDGILSLAPQLAGIDRLVLVNDSCWFPLPGAANWLTEAEALGVDYSAATWTGAVKRPAPADFGRIDWRVDKSLRNFHYASYAIGISQRILRDPGFLAFWQGFRLTQDKNRTVRRGEIGLTRWVIRHGYTHAATNELDDLATRLAGLSDAGFRDLLSRIIIHGDAEMAALHRRAIQDHGAGQMPRSAAEKLILMAVARRGAAYVLADHLVRNDHFAFLKKAPATQSEESRQIVTTLAKGLKGPVGAEILAALAPADATPPNQPASVKLHRQTA
jgi:Rhamnan synthesis protein F